MTHSCNSSKAIKFWLKDDRPREKLLRNGEHTLSNSELIAILLRTGVKGQSALDLARRVLMKFKTFRAMSHTDIAQWSEFKGLGTAKIAQIKAAIEIGRRFGEEEGPRDKLIVASSQEIVDVLMPRMRDLKKEVVKAVFLNSQNAIIDIVDIVEGTVNQASPIIREILQRALQCFAVSLICVHNHPAGDPRPSREDKEFTARLFSAGQVMQINVLDHIIIGDNVYYSFLDEEDLG